MSMSEIVAWTGMAIAAYHFAGYPALLALLAWTKRTRSDSLPERGGSGAALPSVALVIAAYNEKDVIADKLRNCAELDYPPELLSVVVVADGSSDGTAEIVRSSGDPRVIALFDPVRRGKGHALNRAIASVGAEVLVLSDANNHYSSGSIRILVRRLQEAGVGGVSGAKRIVASTERAASGGDGLYWRYESFIKSAESQLGGTVTADGEMFALRRESYTPIPASTVNDDLFLSLRLAERGQKILYDPTATATEHASLTVKEDYRTKVRMMAGGLQELPREWRAICASPSFAAKFISHKVLRWTMPLYLAMALAGSAAAAPWTPLHLLFLGQLAFYGLAVAGAALNSVGIRHSATYVPFYFVVMNAAAVEAAFRAIRGRQTALWTKAARK